MARSLLSRIGANPLGRAGLATVSILALAGLVQFGLPMACNAGAAFCNGESMLAEAEPVEAAAADEPLDAASAPSPQGGGGQENPVQVAAVQQAVLPGTTDLIAQTFSVLDAQLTAPQTELSSRSVRTVAIDADGSPVSEKLPPPAPLVAEASASEAPASSEAAPVDADPAPSPQGGEGQERSVQVAAEEQRSSLAYAPASGDVASVTGKGANVRSQPAKGGSEVLFALPGGEEVTIVQMSKGWAKIVDKSGRSGWIYGEYLDRG